MVAAPGLEPGLPKEEVFKTPESTVPPSSQQLNISYYQ